MLNDYVFLVTDFSQHLCRLSKLRFEIRIWRAVETAVGDCGETQRHKASLKAKLNIGRSVAHISTSYLFFRHHVQLLYHGILVVGHRNQRAPLAFSYQERHNRCRRRLIFLCTITFFVDWRRLLLCAVLIKIFTLIPSSVAYFLTLLQGAYPHI